MEPAHPRLTKGASPQSPLLVHAMGCWGVQRGRSPSAGGTGVSPVVGFITPFLARKGDRGIVETVVGRERYSSRAVVRAGTLARACPPCRTKARKWRAPLWRNSVPLAYNPRYGRPGRTVLVEGLRDLPDGEGGALAGGYRIRGARLLQGPLLRGRAPGAPRQRVCARGVQLQVGRLQEE